MGQVNAIMGASGVGKTTLLNILSCRINPDEGGKRYEQSRVIVTKLRDFAIMSCKPMF